MQKSECQIEIINRIRILRLANNVSQMSLANILDISSGLIGNIESPKFQHKYTLKQLYAIASYFNVKLDYIFTEENQTLDSEKLIQTLIEYDG
ncbi:MAG: helix-turn-helix transcriptional regulator [Duncaniella sp.]|nr:helix-turn-helix transcriptional regulator [Duncaniella sp.]MDE6090263.1 helix-turn-helix transcriptional regulator [Duncaniella sp.]